MIYNDENGEAVSTNLDQNRTVNNEMYQEYYDKIKTQLEVITQIDKTDYIIAFIQQYFKCPDYENLEGCYIYVDQRLSEEDRDILRNFVIDINRLFETAFGVSLEDPNIYLIHCLYQLFVTKSELFFTSYVYGLQKLTAGFVENMPNWDKVSFKYFIKNIAKKDNWLELSGVQKTLLLQEYLDFVLDQCIEPDSLIEVMLLDNEGNVELSALYIEQGNFRLNIEGEFFKLKLKTVMSQDPNSSAIFNNASNLLELVDSSAE